MTIKIGVKKPSRLKFPPCISGCNPNSEVPQCSEGQICHSSSCTTGIRLILKNLTLIKLIELPSHSACVVYVFFLKFFGGHKSFFGATGTPVLDFWWTSPLGFKARVGSALFAFFV